MASDPADGPNLAQAPRIGRKLAFLVAAGVGVVAISAIRSVWSRPADEPPVRMDAARQLRQLADRLLEAILAGRILTVAAGATFYALLALFPGITAIVSLYGLFADAGTVVTHVSLLAGVLPEGVLSLISEQITRIASKGAGTLGFAFFTALALSLWSAMAGMKGIFEALNVIDRTPETRSFVELNLLALAFTLGSIAFAFVAIVFLVVAPLALTATGIDRSEASLALLRWPLLLASVVAYLTLLYRYGPCRSPFRWRWLTVGSLSAGLLWLAVSSGFSYYVTSLGSYNETYGSLGAVMAFMTWMWLSISVVVLGALINVELTDLLQRGSSEDGDAARATASDGKRRP